MPTPPPKRVVRRAPAPAPASEPAPTRRLVRPTTKQVGRFGRPTPEPAKPAGRFRRATPEAQPAPKRSFQKRASSSSDDDGRSSHGTEGWGVYKSTKEMAPSKFEKRFSPPDKGETLIKFLQDLPYTTVLQHWPDWVSKSEKPIYICWKSVMKDPTADCPLCDTGDTANVSSKFNILDLMGGDIPILKVWGVGITLTETLLKYAEDRKTGPLSRLDYYYAVGKTGGKRKTTNIHPVKSRDLPEDYSVEPLTEEELEAFTEKCWDDSSLDWPTLEELEEVAGRLK